MLPRFACDRSIESRSENYRQQQPRYDRPRWRIDAARGDRPGQCKLAPDQLSVAEKSQVQPSSDGMTRIEFSLPSDQTTIRLTEVLPAIERPGLTIDGTTQPGYKPDAVINELP